MRFIWDKAWGNILVHEFVLCPSILWLEIKMLSVCLCFYILSQTCLGLVGFPDSHSPTDEFVDSLWVLVLSRR